jgi:zinc transport system substrate-binding protein
MKYIKKILVLGVLLMCLTGCLKKDSYEDITIYTTDYPVEYITSKLYSNYAEIKSIYPSGINIDSYTITDKKISDFSKGNLFIYNGLTNEKQVAAKLINKNKNMDIIDVSQGLEIQNDVTELWLSPANFLMMAQNIKNGLKDFVTNSTILEYIDNNYDDLKVTISEYDAELKLVAENASNKKIIVANNTFKFLEKYGFEVISISEDDENSNTNITKAKKAFSSKDNTYLFELAGTEETDVIKELVKDGATVIDVEPMKTLTEDELKNKIDYITLMKQFIEAIKSEVY